MIRRLGCFLLALLTVALLAEGTGAETQAPSDAAPTPATLDAVTLKDGTVIYGHVLGMVADELHIKTAFGPTAGEDVVKIMWPNGQTGRESSHSLQPQRGHHGRRHRAARRTRDPHLTSLRRWEHDGGSAGCGRV